MLEWWIDGVWSHGSEKAYTLLYLLFIELIQIVGWWLPFFTLDLNKLDYK